VIGKRHFILLFPHFFHSFTDKCSNIIDIGNAPALQGEVIVSQKKILCARYNQPHIKRTKNIPEI
jgi:hypothetical protein